MTWLDSLRILLTTVYVVSATLLALYTVGQAVLLVLYLRHRRHDDPLPAVSDDDLPTVTVQLPIFNERYVTARLLDAVAALDYPAYKLKVQVLDDSTDETKIEVARRVKAMRYAGLRIAYVHRDDRNGYKAGALANGLHRTDSDLVAVLDADFVPPTDFLRRTAPYFVTNPKLGMVQTRWGHLNHDDNPLTQAQALAIDAHFIVEQAGRCRGGLLMTFNGSGGVWRADAIRDAGGWSDDTLTEDLDLSYRAQLAGWHCLYLPDVVVPGELPPQLTAYRRQQARWAQGSTQVLLKMMRRLFHRRRADLSPGAKLMALQHLCQYIPQALMLVVLLLTPPLLLLDGLRGLPLAPLGIASLAPPLVHVAAQVALGSPRRLLAFPMVVLLGTGLIWRNTRAVLAAFAGQRGHFERTPKFNGSQRSRYALRADRSTVIEAILAVYALAGTLLALMMRPAVAPYLALYALALGMVVMVTLAETHQAAHAPAEEPEAQDHWEPLDIATDPVPAEREDEITLVL